MLVEMDCELARETDSSEQIVVSSHKTRDDGISLRAKLFRTLEALCCSDASLP